MDRYLLKKEFAALCGVSPSAITQASRPGKPLDGAISDNKVDMKSALVQEYLKKKNIILPAEIIENSATKAGLASDFPISDLLALTLGQILEKYGSTKELKQYLDYRKAIADIAIKDLNAEEKRGLLIRRETVEQHLFGYLEELNLKLLRDAPKTLSKRIFSMAQSGEAPEDAEKYAREFISKQIDTARNNCVRIIKKGV